MGKPTHLCLDGLCARVARRGQEPPALHASEPVPHQPRQTYCALPRAVTGTNMICSSISNGFFKTTHVDVARSYVLVNIGDRDSWKCRSEWCCVLYVCDCIKGGGTKGAFKATVTQTDLKPPNTLPETGTSEDHPAPKHIT